MNIPALAAAAVDTAWALGATALRACTLQTGRTTEVDTATDTEELTWESETSLDALIYEVTLKEGDEDVRATPGIGWTAKAMIRVSDLTADSAADPTIESRLVEGDLTWQVTAVTKVPTAPIIILDISR